VQIAVYFVFRRLSLNSFIAANAGDLVISGCALSPSLAGQRKHGAGRPQVRRCE
jgi:hypothetical protein